MRTELHSLVLRLLLAAQITAELQECKEFCYFPHPCAKYGLTHFSVSAVIGSDFGELAGDDHVAHSNNWPLRTNHRLQLR